MRAMLPACGSWRCGGIAWAFRLETAFGRGQTTNSKPACKSGLAGMERMRFTCSNEIAQVRNDQVGNLDTANQLSLKYSGKLHNRVPLDRLSLLSPWERRTR